MAGSTFVCETNARGDAFVRRWDRSGYVNHRSIDGTSGSSGSSMPDDSCDDGKQEISNKQETIEKKLENAEGKKRMERIVIFILSK